MCLIRLELRKFIQSVSGHKLVRGSVVLNKTVFDRDWYFGNLCTSRHQSQSELRIVSWCYLTVDVDTTCSPNESVAAKGVFLFVSVAVSLVTLASFCMVSLFFLVLKLNSLLSRFNGKVPVAVGYVGHSK